MDETFSFGGVKITYKTREPKQDRQHLVVVFAPILPGKTDFYGFDGKALDDVKGSILWIQDSFDGSSAYYLCKNLNFEIEAAVVALIHSHLDRLNLMPSQCTLLGASKGGAAALYFGLKYAFKNVIASVPQTNIGSYARGQYPDLFSFMSNGDADASEAIINERANAAFEEPYDLEKNVYIISSQADPEFYSHISPRLENLDRLTNFNLLLTNSTLVSVHPDVTPYNVPFILGVLYVLCEGLAPRFGSVTNGNGVRDRACADKYFASTPVPAEIKAVFHWSTLTGSQLRFSGYAAITGKEAKEPNSLSTSLLFRNMEQDHVFPVRQVEDRSINYALYREYFRDYRWAGIAPLTAAGIPLDELDPGEYAILAKVNLDSSEFRGAVGGKSKHDAFSVKAGYFYETRFSQAGAEVSKRSLRGSTPENCFYSLDRLLVEESRLRITGTFVVKGRHMRAWNDGLIALTLHNEQADYSFRLGTTPARLSKALPQELDSLVDYRWANFTTPKNVGVDLSGVPFGMYAGTVSLVHAGEVFTAPKGFTLNWNASGSNVHIESDS